MRGKETGTKAPGAQDSQETGGKGDVLMGERKVDNMLPGDTTAGKMRRKGSEARATLRQ